MGRIYTEGCMECWWYEEDDNGKDEVKIPEDKRELVVQAFKVIHKVYEYLDELKLITKCTCKGDGSWPVCDVCYDFDNKGL